MNSVIFFKEELIAPDTVLCSGARARHLFETHELRAGREVQVALYQGQRGRGTVTEAATDRVVLKIALNLPPLTRQHTEVVLAVPRPQTIKKVLLSCAQLGIAAVHFIKSENVEKSYLQSKSLRAEEIEREVLKGLEQSGDSIPPEVAVHRSFRQFCGELLPQRLKLLGGSCKRFIAHTDQNSSEALSLGAALDPQYPVVVAFGPEAGWTPAELERFRELGFSVVGLGERILRVETALVFLLGQIALLRAVSPKPAQ